MLARLWMPVSLRRIVSKMSDEQKALP